MRAYIGVDPGQKGGLALMMNSELHDYCLMPKAMADTFAFFKRGLDVADKSDLTVVMEKVHAMPKQGVNSMFSFGMGFGALQMAATVIGCRLVLVTPQEWKKVVLAGTDKSKDAAIQVCERLFPDVNLVPPGCRTVQDGIAEAILIAEYGRRMNL